MLRVSRYLLPPVVLFLLFLVSKMEEAFHTNSDSFFRKCMGAVLLIGLLVFVKNSRLVNPFETALAPETHQYLKLRLGLMFLYNSTRVDEGRKC